MSTIAMVAVLISALIIPVFVTVATARIINRERAVMREVPLTVFTTADVKGKWRWKVSIRPGREDRFTLLRDGTPVGTVTRVTKGVDKYAIDLTNMDRLGFLTLRAAAAFLIAQYDTID